MVQANGDIEGVEQMPRHHVRGTDVETDPERLAKTTDPDSGLDWQAEIEGRWQALGRRIFVGASEQPPTLLP